MPVFNPVHHRLHFCIDDLKVTLVFVIYLSGLVYVIDRLRFNCTVAPLAEAKRFDVVSVDSSHVRMKTVKEFFGLTNSKNTRMNWTYTGQVR